MDNKLKEMLDAIEIITVECVAFLKDSLNECKKNNCNNHTIAAKDLIRSPKSINVQAKDFLCEFQFLLLAAAIRSYNNICSDYLLANIAFEYIHEDMMLVQQKN